MVMWDKQVDNYNIFANQEDLKRILRDIRYNMDEIVVELSRIEYYVVSDSYTELNEHQEGPIVINDTSQASPQANSTTTSPIIILD